MQRRCRARAGVLVLALALLVGCFPAPEPAADAQKNDPPPMELVPAKRGVGKQGKRLEGQDGLYVTPIRVLFESKQRAVLEMQVPYALKLFQAEHGRFPESHDEFMERIVRANDLRLPELPEGHEYVYFADSGTLMVRRPVETGESPDAP